MDNVFSTYYRKTKHIKDYRDTVCSMQLSKVLFLWGIIVNFSEYKGTLSNLGCMICYSVMLGAELLLCYKQACLFFFFFMCLLPIHRKFCFQNTLKFAKTKKRSLRTLESHAVMWTRSSSLHKWNILHLSFFFFQLFFSTFSVRAQNEISPFWKENRIYPSDSFKQTTKTSFWGATPNVKYFI